MQHPRQRRLPRHHRHRDDPALRRKHTRGRDALIADEPIGRLGTPDEIAAAELWLCSDAASFATGHPLVVGQTV
ncbi:SDR family oxidoreductase [Streptomyces sp. AC555_RSS877]|uniref:SDR family oxidoreductase n=1 Tax=Streptomyces sp. AC555_RSS877 TaxID=2823688 RepID=UPI0027E58EA9|nr:SDR family oxidoreductase [Streptomyces sp. AC555_RSS877]